MESTTASNPRLLVIVGPTAVGKTAVSVEVARLVGGEIISADSMQVYRGMDIGTGKIKPAETKGVHHHLIDVCAPDERFSAAKYVDLADAAVKDISARGLVPIVVGGTGLYIRALVDGFLFEDPGADYEYRKRMIRLAEEQGNEALHQRLAEIDPESATRIHPNDVKRIVRALEVHHTTGLTISAQIAKSHEQPMRYLASFYGLVAPRPTLYDRINQRVDQMVDEGLVQEVMTLVRQGFTSQLTSTQAIGYKEIVDYLNGTHSFEGAIENLKKVTRNYAKRQLSWFRADNRIHWFDICDYADAQRLAAAITANFQKGNYSVERE